MVGAQNGHINVATNLKSGASNLSVISRIILIIFLLHPRRGDSIRIEYVVGTDIVLTVARKEQPLPIRLAIGREQWGGHTLFVVAYDVA